MKTFRNRTDIRFVGKPMGTLRPAIDSDHSVARWVKGPNPEVATTVRLGNALRIKALLNGRSSWGEAPSHAAPRFFAAASAFMADATISRSSDDAVNPRRIASRRTHAF